MALETHRGLRYQRTAKQTDTVELTDGVDESTLKQRGSDHRLALRLVREHRVVIQNLVDSSQPDEEFDIKVVEAFPLISDRHLPKFDAIARDDDHWWVWKHTMRGNVSLIINIVSSQNQKKVVCIKEVTAVDKERSGASKSLGAHILRLTGKTAEEVVKLMENIYSADAQCPVRVVQMEESFDCKIKPAKG